MSETDSIKSKRLGDQIHLPADSNWHRQKESVMKRAVCLKFAQNLNLKEKLKLTGDKILVEATWDLFWGGGATLASLDLKRNTWKGENRQGKILMNIRSDLT